MQRQDLADGGRLVFVPAFVAADEAAALLSRLCDDVPWSQQTLRIAGRLIPEPRLTAWFGDADATYRYSGLVREPLPWSPLVAELRDRVAAIAGVWFNSVLANQYRDGSDSVGFHADAEPELGPNPVIASFSVGATRRFVLVHKRRKDIEALKLELPGGSLLVMAGTTQHFWRHAVPKERRPIGVRVNLTFRRILTKVQDNPGDRK